jgi:S1-C subfamily serine protease
MNENAPEPTPPSRRRRVGAAAVAALGTVGIAAGVAVGAGTASGTTPVVEHGSVAGSLPWVGGGFDGGGLGSGADGFGDGSSGSAGDGSSGSAGSTAATSAQQVGIVDIDTVLGYQGGQAAGTGMVLTPTGEVLTNNHVVSGATSISVTVVSTSATYTASVVGTDASDDVAVLQLDGASGLATAQLGTSPATVGDAVTAVGNAGGTGTLTAASGTVTALDQSITATDSTGGSAERLTGLIETDAAVQPGDSGGPLYGAAGTIVGMDTAASSGGPVQAYAIPIATAERIAAQIEQGVASSTIQQGYPAFLGVSVENGPDGATVLGVLSSGPAAQAGLSAGDVITGVGGQRVASAAGLTAVLAGHSPGDRVTVTWLDAAGGTHSATVALGSGPAR